MPKLEWLQTFIAFAELESFTAAAQRLHLSQPAVHAQIRRLAEELQVELYTRDGRGIRLTDAGHTVLGFARELQARTGALVDALHVPGPPAPVVLAAGEGALSYLLPAALRAFARTAPLRVRTRDHDGTLADVREGTAHLGIVAAARAPRDLDSRVIADVSHALAMPSRHPLARRRRVSARDLDGQSIVVPPEGRPLRRALDYALESAGVEGKVAVEASGWGPILQFVALGLGVAVVNGCCRLPRGVVARTFVDLPRIRYRLVRVPGTGSESARALRELIIAHRDDWRAASRTADPGPGPGPGPSALSPA